MSYVPANESEGEIFVLNPYIDTIYNIHGSITSLYFVIDVYRPVFQYVFGAFCSFTNNGIINRVQLHER